MMKKIVMLSTFLCSFAWIASAQQDFRFGFQLSPSFSWLSVSDDNKINGNGTNLGLRLGVIGEYYFRSNYAFIGGLGFAFNQGGTLKHDIGGNFWPNSDLNEPAINSDDFSLIDGVNLKYGLQYVEIPFGMKFRTQEFGYVRYYAEIPVITLGILTQARGAVSGNTIDTEKEDIKDDVNFFNASWGVGGGVEFSISERTALIGGLFFQNGFADVTGDDGKKYQNGQTTPERSKAANKNITIRLGVMF